MRVGGFQFFEDWSQQEIKKYVLLAFSFVFIVGTYWELRPLKDAVFAGLVGLEHQPLAKMMSVLVIIPLILLYTKLSDMVEKHKLFYFVCGIYSANFLVTAFLLGHPTIGLANTEPDPERYLGWIVYLSIESFGSIVVAMFWSFASIHSDTASAKRGYPLIVTGGQFGAILGPTLATYANEIGIPTLFNIAVINTSIVILGIYLFTKLVQQEELCISTKKRPTGLMEGLKLLMTRPYVVGILLIATIYEVIGTILDYQMKVLGQQEYKTPEDFAMFLGRFGQCANGMALLFGLFGTGFLIKRFGVNICLTIYPVAVGVVVIYVYLQPWLWGVFGAMMALKGMSYALNNPIKEMLYLVTSEDIKYKAKSWIDMFGGRCAKAFGSTITNFFKHSAGELMLYGSLISLGMVGVWLAVALWVGKIYSRLTEERTVIE